MVPELPADFRPRACSSPISPWEFNSHRPREEGVSLNNYFQDFQAEDPIIDLDVTVAGNIPNESIYKEIDEILLDLNNECINVNLDDLNIIDENNIVNMFNENNIVCNSDNLAKIDDNNIVNSEINDENHIVNSDINDENNIVNCDINDENNIVNSEINNENNIINSNFVDNIFNENNIVYNLDNLDRIYQIVAEIQSDNVNMDTIEATNIVHNAIYDRSNENIVFYDLDDCFQNNIRSNNENILNMFVGLNVPEFDPIDHIPMLPLEDEEHHFKNIKFFLDYSKE